MGNDLKIVLIVLAIYIVLGFQNLVNTSVFLIPYELNPLVIFSVSLISIVSSFFQSKKENSTLQLIFFSGILFYAFLSSRTLNLLSNHFQSQIFIEVLNNEFTALLAIVVFYSSLIIVMYRVRAKSYLYFLSLCFLMLSFIGALTNIELLQIIAFTLFVISSITYKKLFLSTRFNGSLLPVLYQLFLFLVLENTYFILIKYC